MGIILINKDSIIQRSEQKKTIDKSCKSLEIAKTVVLCEEETEHISTNR